MNRKALKRAILTLAKGSVDRVFVLGPTAWMPSGGEQDWYFTLAICHRKLGFYLIALHGDDRESTEQTRAHVLRYLAAVRPAVAHILDCEFAMADLCHTLWPSERTKKLAAAAAAEGAENG